MTGDQTGYVSSYAYVGSTVVTCFALCATVGASSVSSVVPLFAEA